MLQHCYPGSMGLLARWGGAPLFAVVLLVYAACPPFPSYDSYWTVPTTLNLLHHGSTAVDNFVIAAPAEARYGLDCVPAGGTGYPYSVRQSCAEGHWYNIYPVAVPLVASPVVAVLLVATRITKIVHLHSARPLIAAFLSGDLVAGRAVTELVCASFFCAVAAWVVYRTAAQFLPTGRAAGLALLFAFGTSQWSISSRSLMQHGPSVLLLAIVIHVAALAYKNPSRIALLSLPLAAAFTVRPSNAIAVAVLSTYVAIHYRAQFFRFVAWSLPIAVPFFTYHLVVRHALFPTYYIYSWAAGMPLFNGLAINLVSPSRGLLIFTPIVLISVVGMALAVRLRWCFPLTPYLVTITIAHSLLIAAYWPGHAYGPRYYADLSPIFAFFLIPAVLLWPKPRTAAACIVIVLAVWSIFVHARGATSTAANLWSSTPMNVDEAPGRVWDWHDPQFLRGL
jgi:hypothetical protein